MKIKEIQDNLTKEFGQYELKKQIGEGGNAPVFRIRNKKNGKEFALKYPSFGKNDNEKKKRFKNEIQIVKKIAGSIPGVIPILDVSKNFSFYTMPIATEIDSFLVGKSFDEIIKGTIQLAETLEKLHKKGISHRDIKPSNIYFYDNRFALGDFGLVSFPNHENLTKSTRGVGAIFTMAPEMRRYPDKADGKKADVYSLAKTLWIFLSDEKKGFEGQYDYLEPKITLRQQLKFDNDRKERHLVELERLLKQSTEYDPDKRPSMQKFKEDLVHFLDIPKDSDEAQASDWNFLNELLFGQNIPKSAKWKDRQSIVNVLNIVSSSPALNHMMSPSGGGLDFNYSELALEKDCIYLITKPFFRILVKPEELIYERFPDIKWNYFLLKLAPQHPILGEFESEFSETLVETPSGDFLTARYAQYKVSDYDKGTPLPTNSRIVHRHTSGSFLIVMKQGHYNDITSTYDGRHNDATYPEQFRHYVETCSKILDNLLKEARKNSNYKALSDSEIKTKLLKSDLFKVNPFKKDLEDDEEKKTVKDQKNKKLYIINNLSSWKINIPPSKSIKSSNILFYFRCSDNAFTFGSQNTPDFYLNKNGYFIKYDNTTLFKSDIPMNDCFVTFDRDNALTISKLTKKQINDHLITAGFDPLDVIDYTIDIECRITKYPKHLFTKEELRQVIQNGDDRVDNVLVIDENGFAHLVQNNEHLYPIHPRRWDAGNVFVGKYSKMEHLNETYHDALKEFLEYLDTNATSEIRRKHCELDKDEDIISEIKRICQIEPQ